MNYVKKKLAFVLALTMAAGTVATGCNSSSSGSAADGSAASGQADAQTAIRLLIYDHENDEIIKAFESANPTIKVEIDIQNENNSTEFLQKLDLMQLSGDTYDVTIMPSYATYAERAVKGFWEPLDSHFEKAGVDPEKFYTVDAKVDGVNYGIPGNPGIYHVLINKTMLDAAGLEVPPMDWTWEDYAEYAAAMTEGEGASKIYGSYMHTWTEYRRENMWCVKDDNCYINADGTSNLSDPNFGQWLTFIKGMEDNGVQVPYQDAKATNMAYRDVYFSGKAAMVLTGSWMYNDINDTENFPHDFATVFAPFPRWKDSKAGRCEADSGFNVINAKSQNKEAAFTLVSYLSSEEASNVSLHTSSVRGADNTAIIKKTVAGHENLYDLDSLVRIWNNPDLQAVGLRSHLKTFTEIDEIYNAETEKFMVGGQDLDTTLKNIQEKGNTIIDKMGK